MQGTPDSLWRCLMGGYYATISVMLHHEKDENKPCFAALVAQVKEAKVNKVRDFSREPGYEGHVQAFNTANQPVNSTC